MENDIKTIPIRITVEKTIRFQRCLDVTPEQLEKNQNRRESVSRFAAGAFCSGS